MSVKAVSIHTLSLKFCIKNFEKITFDPQNLQSLFKRVPQSKQHHHVLGFLLLQLVWAEIAQPPLVTDGNVCQEELDRSVFKQWLTLKAVDGLCDLQNLSRGVGKDGDGPDTAGPDPG